MTQEFSNIDTLRNYFECESKKYRDNNISILKSSDLTELISISIDSSLIQILSNPDIQKPYGRKVLYQDNLIEIMVATWTTQEMCEPHDHGGAWSAIRILQGTATHNLYHISNDSLLCVFTEMRRKGDTIQCTPHQIHAMGAMGLAESQNLITLHAYSKNIPFMLVYDMEKNQTVQVDGSCGAWIPKNRSQIIEVFDKSISFSYISEKQISLSF